jgi:hypothetical protein
MNAETLAISMARCRIAVGIAAIAVPGTLIDTIVPDRAADGIAPALLRMLGGRDIALGLGTVVALDHGAPVRGWLEGGALSDAMDGVASLLARRRLKPAAWVAMAGISGASALLGLVLARGLDPPPSPHPGQPEAIVTGHTPGPEADH